MIKVVLFDIDGTLIRTGGAGVKAFQRGFESAFGVPDATRSVDFAGRTDSSLVRELCGRHSIPPTPENFELFFLHYIDWLQTLLPQLKGEACPGVAHVIESIRNLSHSPLIGLLTGNIRRGAQAKLEHYKLWDHFAFGAFGDDHEDRNELARVGHQRAQELLNDEIRGDEILVIGDTYRDIECARAINAKVLAVATGTHSVEQLLKHQPDWAMEDFTTVVIADICS